MNHDVDDEVSPAEHLIRAAAQYAVWCATEWVQDHLLFADETAFDVENLTLVVLKTAIAQMEAAITERHAALTQAEPVPLAHRAPTDWNLELGACLEELHWEVMRARYDTKPPLAWKKACQRVVEARSSIGDRSRTDYSDYCLDTSEALHDRLRKIRAVWVKNSSLPDPQQKVEVTSISLV